MFWGLILKNGKKYSQTVRKAFHLSAASLDTSTTKTGDDIQVLLTSDDNVYILCTLNKENDKQRSLDLNFAEGDKICFSIKGEGIVHLTGFLIPEVDDEFMEDESDEEEEAVAEKNPNSAEKSGKKKDKKAEKNPLLKLVTDEDEESDEMDDSFDPTNAAEEDSDDSDEEAEDEEGEAGVADDSDDDEEDEDDSDEEESDEDASPPAKKMQKGQDGQKVKQNGVENGKASSKEQQKKEKQGKDQQSGPKTLQGGVQVLDLKPGQGPEAKPGKKVAVYYEGRLKQNNKVFDSSKAGHGFKFKLGGGEVIKGWDVGVAGMKVGGKRRITCPPHMAYGQKGSPPVIPSNSTLVFDVELKNVF